MPNVKPNWPLLAGMRIVLALIVVFFHASEVFADGSARAWHAVGPIAAVAVFLVISGLCMAHSFQDRAEGFYRRRFWRIYPTFAVAMALGTIPLVIWSPSAIMSTVHVAPPSPVSIAWAFAGFPGPNFGGHELNGSLWSLFAEMRYYALVPLLFRLRGRYVAALILASCAASFGVGAQYDYLTCAAFFWPFGLGWLVYRHWNDKGGNNQCVRALLLLLPPLMLIRDAAAGGTWGPALFVICAALILAMERIRIPPKLAAMLNYLGDLSFPVYAVHFALIWILLLCRAPAALLHPWPVALIALAVSAAILHCIDRPLRRFGRESLFRRPALEAAQV